MTRETDKLSPLPRSLDPLPDESLPGYLLRLAHRLGLAPARVIQLTGLTAGRDCRQPARRSLMLHLDEAPAGAFARATRLTAAEASQLCMSSMSGQYPWAAPQLTADKWGPRALASPWVFASATRYCPQCLAGDGSPVQQQHGGAWQKAWRLPVVFACPAHRQLLEHLCPSCRQPPMSAGPGTSALLIPRAGDGGLHPAQCRAALRPQDAGRHARPCGATLDAPARAEEDSPVSDDLLALQSQLLQLLNPEGPAAAMSVGHPATPAQYFADLRLICSLINGTWPHSRNLITGPGLAQSLSQYIASTGGTAPQRHALCDAPPLDARPGAALITAAARILDGSDLLILGELLAPARDGATRKTPRGRWIRRYQRAGHDCSDGFQNALEPLINSFQHTDRRSRGRRAPAPQISFAPEHIPEHLQDDWYHEHFRRIGGNTRLLRRAAALRLVQISAGGSLAEAAAFLGIDDRYLKASPGSAAFAGDPAEFRLAVHALARQLSTTTGLTDYKHRRDALQDWCIDPAAWQDIISQLPPTKGPFQPELSDCKRQFASEAVWARITQGEHLLAPRIIENRLSAGDPTWHRRRDNMWHFYKASPAKPHYAALSELLNMHADNQAAAIDRLTPDKPGKRHLSLGVTIRRPNRLPARRRLRQKGFYDHYRYSGLAQPVLVRAVDTFTRPIAPMSRLDTSVPVRLGGRAEVLGVLLNRGDVRGGVSPHLVEVRVVVLVADNQGRTVARAVLAPAGEPGNDAHNRLPIFCGGSRSAVGRTGPISSVRPAGAFGQRRSPGGAGLDSGLSRRPVRNKERDLFEPGSLSGRDPRCRHAPGGGRMTDGFSADRAALRETAQGIDNTIGALKGLGFDEEADAGRGFSGLELSGLQAGDGGVQRAFGDFCARWSWGVRSLVQDGNQFASRLGITAGVYADTEEYLTGVAKDVLDSLAGDPHLSDAQAAAASWSQPGTGSTPGIAGIAGRVSGL